MTKRVLLPIGFGMMAFFRPTKPVHENGSRLASGITPATNMGVE